MINFLLRINCMMSEHVYSIFLDVIVDVRSVKSITFKWNF